MADDDAPGAGAGAPPSPDWHDFFDWLVGWTWPVDEAWNHRVLEERGWTLLDDAPGRGSTWDTHLGPDRAWASVRIAHGVVDDVGIITVRGAPDQAGRAAAAAVLAAQIAAVTAVAGPPNLTAGVPASRALWDLPNGATLDLGHHAGSCQVDLTSPGYAEIQRQLED